MRRTGRGSAATCFSSTERRCRADAGQVLLALVERLLGLVGEPLVAGSHLLALQFDALLRRRDLGEALAQLLQHPDLLVVTVVEHFARVLHAVERA